MNSKPLPVVTNIGNRHSLQNHLDTLLDVASAQDKNLQAINKAYSGLIKSLIAAAQGKEEISKSQLDCIKILLSEHKHLNKVVADIEELIKKVRIYQDEEEAKHTPSKSSSKQKISLPKIPLDTPMYGGEK
ncbi:hypothetical protein P3553_10480 [Vibrio parahaemolyticus]|uniref:hypothetical protein n=1 Tax=Vibrio parahaemolyticus TaxID=670 RepID=UPI00084A6FE0|nr:hypothetical protein [Vibrio parahaemolyticus]MBO0167121.1 hypothetical protein [Vibrio parahaemolyticus]MDF4752525.1 hypothetical protein [Vibrio parahaemolyticus]MDF4778639.1 hypothetical protein [Vibrio parahaemolyticus]MDF4783656.1 hypothetical protein [Vibrio parahaemolyticus]MDF4794482.1 hypothetical protein [Vibrio parahaemolyticus]